MAKDHCIRMSLRRFLLLIASFVFVQVTILTIRSQTNGLTNAWLRRIQTVIALQFVMLLVSTMVYNRIENLLQSTRDNDDSHLPFIFSRSNANVWRTFTVVVLVLSHGRSLFYYFLQSAEPHWLALVCLISYGFYIHVAALLCGSIVAEWLLRLFKPRGPQWLRKLLWSQNVHTMLALVLSVVLLVFGLVAAGMPATIVEVDLKMSSMPLQMSRFKLVLLTDVHIGPSVGRQRVLQIVEQVNKLQPDLVAISGDLVDGDLRDLQLAAEPLSELTSTFGTYFVTGNHEYYHGDIDEWLLYFESVGIHPLHNANRRFDHTNSLCEYTDHRRRCFCIAGVDDISAENTRISDHHLNITSAMSGCSLGDTVVLLAHQPAAAVKVLKSEFADRIDLILAGHTHGGQMYVIAPIVYWLHRYFIGLYYDATTNTNIYVSAGVNWFGPPVKMWGLNEITLLNLHA